MWGELEQMLSQIENAVVNYGAKAVIKAVAESCRMNAQVEIEQQNYPAAGTLNHYASTLEELVGDEQ